MASKALFTIVEGALALGEWYRTSCKDIFLFSFVILHSIQNGPWPWEGRGTFSYNQDLSHSWGSFQESHFNKNAQRWQRGINQIDEIDIKLDVYWWKSEPGSCFLYEKKETKYNFKQKQGFEGNVFDCRGRSDSSRRIPDFLWVIETIVF